MDFNVGGPQGPKRADRKPAARRGGGLTGWLVTAVAPFGENEEHAMDQALVELGLGDARLIRGEGAMLPTGFEPGQPQDLPMGTLVECHLAKATVHESGIASAGVAWALCVTPEGDECAIVSTLAMRESMEDCSAELRRNLQRKLANRDLELRKDEEGRVMFDSAVDEIEGQADFHGVVLAALILPNSLNMGGGPSGPVRSRSAGVSSIGGGVGGPTGLGGSGSSDFGL
jgi:pyruvoyl-dependent arginine decarboxylase (PvlArgDC)